LKVPKAWAEDFDKSFRYLKFEGVIIEKAKGTRTGRTKASNPILTPKEMPSVPDEHGRGAVSKRGRPKKIR